jgi:hypothetical protein
VKHWPALSTALLAMLVTGCVSRPPALTASKNGDTTCRRVGAYARRCATAEQWRQSDAMLARSYRAEEGFDSNHVIVGTQQDTRGSPWPPSQCCAP